MIFDQYLLVRCITYWHYCKSHIHSTFRTGLGLSFGCSASLILGHVLVAWQRCWCLSTTCNWPQAPCSSVLSSMTMVNMPTHPAPFTARQSCVPTFAHTVHSLPSSWPQKPCMIHVRNQYLIDQCIDVESRTYQAFCLFSNSMWSGERELWKTSKGLLLKRKCLFYWWWC